MNVLFHGKPWDFKGRRMERNAPVGTRCTPACTHPQPGINSTVAICRVCHEAFGCVTNFDRHRRDGWCLDPAKLGLSLDQHGYWRASMAPGVKEALRAAPDPRKRHP